MARRPAWGTTGHQHHEGSFIGRHSRDQISREDPLQPEQLRTGGAVRLAGRKVIPHRATYWPVIRPMVEAFSLTRWSVPLTSVSS